MSMQFISCCHHFVFSLIITIIWLCGIPTICIFVTFLDRNVAKVLSTTDVHFQASFAVFMLVVFVFGGVNWLTELKNITVSANLLYL